MKPMDRTRTPLVSTHAASTRGVALAVMLAAALLAAQGALAAPARAWEWFRGENGNVREGNERLRANDAAGALRAYEAAARELPSDPGVHLNRGLALLALSQHDKAREAFLLATEPPAPAAIRAAAYYDLGLAFYRQADAAATAAANDAIAQGAAQPSAVQPGTGQQGTGAAPEADHREAQRLFREAADGFRRSLRIQPGNRDAAWNLELALRRLREEEEAQRREEEQQRQQQQDQQQQDQQQQDQQQQDQQQQDQQQQDGQQGEDGQPQQPQDGQPQNQPPRDGQQGQEPQQPSQDGQQPQDGQQGQEPPQPDPQPQPGEATEPQGGEREQQPAAPSEDGLPAEAARVLDALRDGEENLERYRARARALRENRAPAQDW